MRDIENAREKERKRERTRCVELCTSADDDTRPGNGRYACARLYACMYSRRTQTLQFLFTAVVSNCFADILLVYSYRYDHAFNLFGVSIGRFYL
ncbi:hypothetical protein PUN28_015107 [Cardiocondyla obscurior]|uniref:Uncharacterized protein n=1 Tax=Cardiocondyla obscurior TaxID=286306 RepID=A0AAW2F350_9HYME